MGSRSSFSISRRACGSAAAQKALDAARNDGSTFRRFRYHRREVSIEGDPSHDIGAMLTEFHTRPLDGECLVNIAQWQGLIGPGN
jgi:hypothetical protein